jgi:hypothetical protein
LIEIGSINSLWGNPKSECSIKLHWKLNCPDTDITAGFNISYAIVNEFDSRIIHDEPEFYVVFMSENINNELELFGLKPYHKYKISIALISISNRVGAFSSPITVRTMEACELF